MHTIFERLSYRELVIKNNYNVIDFLLKEGIEFSIGCYVDVVNFNPPIPSDIIEFNEFTIFAIVNYTFESAKVNKEYLEFEAGFGPSNFASIVQVPLDAIAWIAVNQDEYIAISHYRPKIRIKSKEEEIQNSMQALLQNPENLKIIKEKRKK